MVSRCTPTTASCDTASTNLKTKGDLLQLALHAIEFVDISSRAHQILGLDLAGADLTLLGGCANLSHKGLLLLLQLDTLLIQFSDGLVEESLILSQTLCRRHALAESPLQNLGIVSVGPYYFDCKCRVTAIWERRAG